MGRLVWLFKEHRDLNTQFQTLLRIIEEKNRTILDLERQLTTMVTPQNLAQVLETVFTEAPFPDGRIPEDLWLTPEDARAER